MRTIRDIIDLAGGPVAIAREAAARGDRLTAGSVYKWANFSDLGIPERHWRTVMDLSGRKVTPKMLHEANELRRAKRTEH